MDIVHITAAAAAAADETESFAQILAQLGILSAVVGVIVLMRWGSQVGDEKVTTEVDGETDDEV